MSIPKDLTASIPPPADAKLVSRIARQSPIGQCLEEALQTLVTQSQNAPASNAAEENDDETDHGDSSESANAGNPGEENDSNDGVELSVPILDSAMSERILQSFGVAVAETRWHEDKNKDKDNHTRTIPPAALLRGRLDHYNRFGGQWRIVVEEGELLHRNKVENQGQTRKRDRPTLWDACQKRATTRENQTPVRINGSTQLLAYNDM